MAEPIGALRAEMSAGHAQFESDMKKAKDAVKKNATGMSAAMDKVGKKFTEAATALNKYAGYAIAGAILATTAIIKKQITVADEMGKLAQSTGTTSEYLSSMALVASQGGTDLETLAKGIKRLSQNLYDARDGLKTSKQLFDDLGITVTDNNGILKKADQVLPEIADKFKGLEDGSEKTAYALKIFGRAGTDLIPILNGGSRGIKDLQKKAQEMGLVISTETALQAAYFNDQLDILMKNAQGTGRSLALQLLPWLNETMDILKFTKEESGGLMAAWVALGAVGEAIFSKSLTQKIKETQKEIDNLKKKQDSLADNFEYNTKRLSEKQKEPFEKNYLERVKVYQDQIDKLQVKLSELEAQKQREDNAEKARMEAAQKRIQAEAEQRRKNTEQLIKDSEARIKAESKARQVEAEKKAELKAIEDAENAVKAEGIALTKSLMTAQEEYNEKIEYYHYLLNQGAIDHETLNRASKKALEDLGDTGTNVFKELGNQIEGWGRDSARAITDFALEGKGSFSDMVKSMIAEMLQLMIYQKLLGPLFNTFGNWVEGLGGVIPSAHGNVFSNGKVIPFARGGIISRPTLLPMAQGAALTGEAGPEGILPLKRIGGDLGVKASMGTPIINIYNNVGANVTTKERQTAGGVELDVMIDNAVANKLRQQGSQSNKAVRQSFGARTQLTGR